MDSPATRDIGLIVIQQPDGELCLGEDPLAPKPQKAAQTSASAPENQTLIHYLQHAHEGTSEAALAEQRDRAHLYATTTLRRRKTLFAILLVCDLLFFAGALFYRRYHGHVSQPGPTAEAAILQPPSHNMTSTDITNSSTNSSISDSTTGSHSSHRAITLTWWLDPQTIRGEDAVLSFAADLVGLTGALQNRTVVLVLYWVIQLLSMGSLSTTGGLTLSLFTMYRLLQLLLALYLRSAICTYTSLLEAAELVAEQPTASHRIYQVLQRYPSVAALLGGLPGWQQQQYGQHQTQWQH